MERHFESTNGLSEQDGGLYVCKADFFRSHYDQAKWSCDSILMMTMFQAVQVAKEAGGEVIHVGGVKLHES